MTPPLLAFLDVNPDRVASIVVNLLAVAGGFFGGLILTAIVTFLIDRKVTGGKSPAGLHKTARVSGGLLGALLVALLVFGDGFGTGPGDGPGDTDETGTGAGTGQTTITTPVTSPSPEDVPPEVPPPDPTKPIETLRVTVLSGANVKEQRFYVVEGEPTPLTLDAVKKTMATRKAATDKTVAIEVILSARTDPQGSGAQSLIAAAQEAGLRVVLPGPR